MRLNWFAKVGTTLTVTVGLLLAPLAAPVMAMPVPAAAEAQAMSMTDDMSMTDHVSMAHDMSSMADGMPCCPDQTKSKGCDSCPFVALCMLGVSLPTPSGAATLVQRHPLRTAFAAKDDRLVDGLGAKPPDHPPRILI